MLTLFENAFSPFARKVRLVLEHKGLEYEVVDGLAKSNRDRLKAVNGRIEVPTLVDAGLADGGDLVVTNSADIVDYLERRFVDRPVYPADLATYTVARSWERCADGTVDPILVDISYWFWADREDNMPEGMLAAAQADMNQIYDRLEAQLGDQDFLCGELGIADIALFPHLTGTRLLGVSYDAKEHPKVHAWQRRLRSIAIFAADLARTKAYLADVSELDIERKKIFWRGDRIEWVLARGYADWFMGEIKQDRVLWPGLGVPR